jgi:hypothetical protein
MGFRLKFFSNNEPQEVCYENQMDDSSVCICAHCA